MAGHGVKSVIITFQDVIIQDLTPLFATLKGAVRAYIEDQLYDPELGGTSFAGCLRCLGERSTACSPTKAALPAI